MTEATQLEDLAIEVQQAFNNHKMPSQKRVSKHTTIQEYVADQIKAALAAQKADLIQWAESKKYTEDRGMDTEMRAYNGALDDLLTHLRKET